MKVYWLNLTWLWPTFSIMLSAARLPQVRAEACISLQVSWERSKVRRTVRTMLGELKVQLRNVGIVVRRTVRSMFVEQTFAQLRTGFTVFKQMPCDTGEDGPVKGYPEPVLWDLYGSLPLSLRWILCSRNNGGPLILAREWDEFPGNKLHRFIDYHPAAQTEEKWLL